MTSRTTTREPQVQPIEDAFARIQAARRGAIGPSRARRPISPAALARRRRAVATAKRALPLAALALLAAIGLWPEFSRDVDRQRLSLQQAGAAAESGQMIDATYHSVDDRGRPYTVTATHAREATPGRIQLTDPAADLTQSNGGWLMGRAKRGLYDQHDGDLDVWGDVQLYRDDGTTLITSSANIDLRAGAAAGSEQVHAEGPFGTLDAQGFASTDRGAIIQFTGPGRLVLNARSK
jgi:lipopolysaccharide export system protein LptC